MKLLKRIVNKLVQFILNKPNDSSSNTIKSDSISYGGVNYTGEKSQNNFILQTFSRSI